MNYQDIFEQEETIDIREIIAKYLIHWKIYLLFLVISLGFAFLVNRYTKPTYKVTSKVLVRDEQQLMDPKTILGGGMISDQFSYKMRNEIGIIKSKELTRRSIEKLPLTISYFDEENFLSDEVYKASPFTVSFDTLHAQVISTRYNIHLLNDSIFVISISSKEVPVYSYVSDKTLFLLPILSFKDTAAFGDTVLSSHFSFVINKNYRFNNKEAEYSFLFNSRQHLINQYRQFKISQIDNSTILELSAEDNNVAKSVDFLNTLMKEYLKKGIERKNQIAVNTIQFINGQIESITDSLNYSEARLQDFRTNNKLMNLDFQSQQIISRLEDLQSQQANLTIKLRYFEYLKKYLADNKDVKNMAAPSSIEIDDQMLNSLVMELTSLYSERSEMSFNSKKENPYLESLDRQIENRKQSIAENIENSIRTTEMAIKNINSRINEMSAKISKLPGTQRQLLGIERTYKLNDELYTYLLTKRSEMQISKASNLPVNEIIEYASPEDYQLISPNIIFKKKKQ